MSVVRAIVAVLLACAAAASFGLCFALVGWADPNGWAAWRVGVMSGAFGALVAVPMALAAAWESSR